MKTQVMKKIALFIFFAIASIIIFSCKKENELLLAPVGSLKINLTLKDYSNNKLQKKTFAIQNLKKEVIPNSFKASITIKGKDVPERTTTSEANYDGNFYQLSLPVEVPLNKSFSITITTKTDSTSWKGFSTEIILQENMLPYQAIITLGISSITDVDGNVYNTIALGSQLWLASNLKVTHYRNGDPITYASDAAQWTSLTFTGAYCNLNNDNSNVAHYGRLYKYYTTVDSRGLCPSGWSIPSNTDWDLLAANLGGAATAGGMMKISGTSYWASPNVGADNSSGFSAYPSLSRDLSGVFDNQAGSAAIWWSSTIWDTNNVFAYEITNDNTSITSIPRPMEDGLAIRCIKL